jgi:hypothetical protein
MLATLQGRLLMDSLTYAIPRTACHRLRLVADRPGGSVHRISLELAPAVTRLRRRPVKGPCGLWLALVAAALPCEAQFFGLAGDFKRLAAA